MCISMLVDLYGSQLEAAGNRCLSLGILFRKPYLPSVWWDIVCVSVFGHYVGTVVVRFVVLFLVSLWIKKICVTQCTLLLWSARLDVHDTVPLKS